MSALVLAVAVVAVLVTRDVAQAHRRLRGLTAPDDAPRPGAWRRDRRPPDAEQIPSPLLLELLAALLESGASPSTALRHLAFSLTRAGDQRGAVLETLAADVEHDAAGADRPGATVPSRREAGRRLLALVTRRASDRAAHAPDTALVVLQDAVRMAAAAGLPPAALVRRAASEERRRLAATRRRSIQRMEVLLVVPVGLCLLPAFVLIGVVPVVIHLFTG